MSKKQVGTMPSGAAVYEIGLANGKGMSVNILTYGAIIKDIFVPDKDGNIGNVVLGQDTFEDVREKAFCNAMLVGRVANRIKGASFEIDGNVYHLQANEFANTLHSGDANYAKRNFEIAEEDGKSVTLTLDDPEETAGGFPGNAKLSVTYTVTDDCTLLIAYDFICDKDTPVNLTNHAYFNLRGHGAGDIGDQLVWINADTFTPADAASIPTGEIIPVEGTPMDFTIMKPIGQDINADYDQLKFGNGYDHNYVLNGWDGKLNLVAKAKDPVSGRKLKVYTDLPGMQFYTGNSLKESHAPGKGGARYLFRTGYCFETQFYPDSVNHPEWPRPVFGPGEEYHHFTVYKFEATKLFMPLEEPEEGN